MHGDEKKLRENLLELLKGGGAHLTFEDAVKGLAVALRGKKVKGSPHTAWRLVEHMRIAQRDILEFVRNPEYESPEWPDGYWPKEDAPARGTWEKSVKGFLADRAALAKIVTDRGVDLLAPIPHGQGQTIAREVMLAADHTAYHVGQLVMLRRALGAWKGE